MTGLVDSFTAPKVGLYMRPFAITGEHWISPSQSQDYWSNNASRTMPVVIDSASQPASCPPRASNEAALDDHNHNILHLSPRVVSPLINRRDETSHCGYDFRCRNETEMERNAVDLFEAVELFYDIKHTERHDDLP